MSQTVTLRALGLNYSPNALSLPDGSLVQADDVVIRRDNTIEPRRGFSEYSEPIGAGADRIKQLFEYKGRLLAHYSNKIAFDSGTLNDEGKAIFGAFDGTYSETQDGLRIKAIEANKNLYFTTSAGIKKISAKSAADLTTSPGVIRDAGTIKALNISANLDVQQGQLSGFLPADSAVAYRVVWGYKDNNDNLNLGVPSNRVEVYNYLSDTTGMDLNALCVVLDSINQTGSLINNGNYATSFFTPISSDAAVLQANVLALATKLDTDLYLASATGTSVPLRTSTFALTNNVVTITFSSGDPTTIFTINDQIELLNLPAPFDVLNGSHKLDFAPTSTTIKFTFTNANITSSTPTVADIFSNNYQTITRTADDVFTTPLSELIISSPATSEQQRTINNTLRRIVDQIKNERSGVISTYLQSTYVSGYTLTELANTKLEITVPPGIDSQYFLQVYRSRIFTASDVQTLGGSGGIPITPDDEMRLVFEDFPTNSEITAGTKLFTDSSPEQLVENNTNLYTNPETGEGIIKANEPPPFAKDINRFKNVTFFSNTRTRQRVASFQLLGVANISNQDKLTIASANGSETFTFVDGVREITSVTCTAGSAITTGTFFEIYNPVGQKFRLWFQVNGTGTEPIQANTICIKVPILSTYTSSEVAQRTIDVVNTITLDFRAEANTLPALKITCLEEGKTQDASSGTSGFTISVLQQGNGEDAAAKQVLKSSLLSAAQAIDETAQSLVRVINKQAAGIVSAYYISSDTTPPGQINIEAKILSPTPFYIVGNNTTFGSAFNPDIGPVHSNINSIAIGNPTSITTSSAHGLNNGDSIVISGSNSTPSADGVHVVTAINSTTFTIPLIVTASGTIGSWSKVEDATISTNETKPNRIYYSKLDQPDAVPLLNYFPVGAEDKEILRIVPLRDSLFVLKEDGAYRVSGEIAPFVTSLLDSSCIVIAPDSIGITNNTIYAWTLKGITPITETGAGQEISRPIDTVLQKLCSTHFTNFNKITFGFGYNSDSSYTVFTNKEQSDTVATIGFRYCTLTNTWTNVVRSQTCGLVMSANDLLTLGAAGSNVIEKERKNYDRTDYSDKDFQIILGTKSTYNNGTLMSFTSVDDINIGDVLVQDQTLTTYRFNNLLMQLDSDPTVGVMSLVSTTGAGKTITVNVASSHSLVSGDSVSFSETNSFPSLDGTYPVTVIDSDTFTIQVASPLVSQASIGKVKRSYEFTLSAVTGDNMRDKIVALASKLDSDPSLSINDYSTRIAAKSGSILSNATGGETTVSTSAAHGLVSGRRVTVIGTQSPSSTPSIVGIHNVSDTGTYGSSTTFKLPINVITSGGTGLTYSTAQNLNTFDDIKACFNEIVTTLNVDNGTTYNTYLPIDTTTPFEAVVLSVDYRLGKITVNLPIQWVVGPITVFKAINCEITYSPATFGDPLSTKQIREATFMFENRALTQFTTSYSSDLKPEFVENTFSGSGNGIFGEYSSPGFGYGNFGGLSNSAPFRTIIPRDCQRCRFINVKLNHKVAREIFSLYGITLIGNVALSSRGYR
jgi:hypothetical protein